MKKILIILLLFIAAVGFSQEYDAWNIDSVQAMYHGYCYTVEVDGDFVYYSDNNYVQIRDISTPENPVQISEIELPNTIYESIKIDDLIFYSLHDSGICIIDVSDPYEPEIAAHILSGLYVNSVFIEDTLAYVCTDDLGLVILDITDLSMVEEVGRIDLPECSIKSLDIDSIFAFIATNSGVIICDISEISSPVEVYRIEGYIPWCRVNDNILYCSSSTLRSYDISNPESPILLDINYFTSAYISGAQYPGVAIRDNQYFFADSHLYIYDISNPDSIIGLSQSIFFGEASDIKLVGDYAYLADKYGMAILDITDLTDISLLSYNYTNLYMREMFSYHNNLYGSSGNIRHLLRFDKNESVEPFNITEISRCNDSQFISEYFFTRSYSLLEIWDFANHRAPSLVHSFDRDYLPIGIIDDIALMYCEEKLYTFYIADASAPVLVDSFTFEEIPQKYITKDNILFDVYRDSLRNNNLKICNVVNAHNIIERSRISIPYYTEDMSTYMNTLIMCFGDDGTGFVDFSDPSAPIYEYNPAVQIKDIQISGNIGVAQSISDRIEIYDLTDVTSPELVGFFYDSNSIYEYQLVGTDIYISINFGWRATQSLMYILDISSFFEETTYEISRGWNLISYPFEGERALEYYVFPIYDPAFLYDESSRLYEPIPHLEAGEGYWVLADTDSIIHYIDVVPVDSLDIELVPGWNLIGGLNEPLPMTYFTDLPAVTGPCYEYDPASEAYIASDTLRPQKGYWILSTDSVTVHLP